MILKSGQIIGSETRSYEIGDLLYHDHSGVREEYAAICRIAGCDTPEIVRLVVCDVTGADDPQAPLREEELYAADTPTALIEAFTTDIEAVVHSTEAEGAEEAAVATAEDAVSTCRVIATGWTETQSLAQAVASGEWTTEEAKGAFAALVRELRRIYREGRGTCHFNLCPDTVHIHTDADGSMQALLLGMNYAARDMRTLPFDPKFLDNAYRAPETHMGLFSTASMQMSLAMLYCWMMTGEHPWKLKSQFDPKHYDAHMAYRAMRNEKPVIELDEALRQPLLRALSFSQSARFPKIDALVRALDAASPLPLGPGYDTFEPAGTDPEPVAEYPAEPEKGREKKTDREKAREDGAGMSPGASSSADGKDGSGERRHEPEPPRRREPDPNTKDEGGPDNPREPRLRVKMEPVEGDGFNAVAGMDQLKKDLKRDFIDIVNHRELAKEFGLTVPGVLMYGPPGTGKSYIAQRLAEELGIDVTFVYPADLGNIFVHGSQTLIKQLFETAERQAAKNKKGVLLVFDEIDALVPQRSADDHGNQAGEVAEFLTRLNDASSRGVYVIGTTNCLDRVDKAVLRKGRLDKVVYVGMPDEEARTELFKYELAKRPADKAIDPRRLAGMTDGYTSSDITYIVTESARQTFAEVIERHDTKGSISQSVIEKVIADTRPSVTRGDLRHYEEMRDKYATGTRLTPRVGFMQ